MNVMTKRGSLDNIVTYEHFCDSIEDLKNIPENEITLGSTVIVIDSENNTIIPYIANSKKQWIPLISISGGDSSSEDDDESEECIYIPYAEQLNYSWNDLNEMVEAGKAVILTKPANDRNGTVCYYLATLEDNYDIEYGYAAIFVTLPNLSIIYTSDSPTGLLEIE